MPTQPAPTGGYRAPVTRAEQILAGIYAQLLDKNRVGINESFFDLGGDSLSAMRATTAINGALDTHLTLPTLINAPTIKDLSRQLNTHVNPTTDR